jgi:Tfp pilus assembly protein PilF
MNWLSLRLWVLLAGGLVLGAGAAIIIIPRLRDGGPPQPAQPASSAPADPRLTYSGPYLNIRPDVQYVGDAVCADCHADKVETFKKHPMGRSMSPVADGLKLPMDSAAHNPFQAFGSTLRMEKQGQRYFQRETRTDASGKIIYENAMPVDYVIGSGNHGHSFLCDRDGYVFQTPISWYSSKHIWDVSPGWSAFGAGRTVNVHCLYCHANRVEVEPGYINRYREPLFRGYSIGCERCHGPGEKHAATAGAPFTIVNPKKLTPALREAVCQQCHLEGEKRLVRRGRGPFDFRPGLPIEEFWSIFVHAGNDEDHKAVNHVEQMYQSTCFKKSAGLSQMGCSTCHDPHVKVGPPESVAWYRQKCLDCHQPAGCKVPEVERRKSSAADSCIDCHMKKSATSDIVHTAGTDHRILRVAPGASAAVAHSEAQPEYPLRLFHKPPAEKYSGEDARDLGVALAWHTFAGKTPQKYAIEAQRMLERGLQDHPDDAEAWDAKATALQLQNRRIEALSALRKALELEPDNEMILANAALLAQKMDRLDEAAGYWRRAIAMNPWQPHYHGNLAMLLLFKDDIEAARKYGEEWLKLDPGNLDARKFWVSYWLKAGNKDKAAAAFESIEELNPPNLVELKAWFARQKR